MDGDGVATRDARTVHEHLLNRTHRCVNDTYLGALLLSHCASLTANDAKLPKVKREELTHSYADRAMELLRQAIAKGFKDVARLKKAPDLDRLRHRDDFKALLSDLEKKPYIETK